ncbi:MAG: Bax inhibitor-1 family protein [Betaproteobacteria bacterium]|nr:Bax inhibitor-1 family protein [Betaproteobacteria bacterium]
MSDIQILNPSGASGTLAASQNRVLRNTYMLLALSLVPTVAGAWLGVQMKFSLFAGSPFLGFMLFMAIAFGFFYAIEKTKNSAWGVAILLGFTFFMGLMLSRLIERTLGFSNGGALIATAFGGTSAIFFGMATLAGTIKRDLSNMGKFLMMGVLLLIVAAVANIFLQIPALMLTIMVLAVGIFSALLLYDVNRIITGGETNYISATLAIYLDIYNIFTNLLALLGIGGGND